GKACGRTWGQAGRSRPRPRTAPAPPVHAQTGLEARTSAKGTSPMPHRPPEPASPGITHRTEGQAQINNTSHPKTYPGDRTRQKTKTTAPTRPARPIHTQITNSTKTAPSQLTESVRWRMRPTLCDQREASQGRAPTRRSGADPCRPAWLIGARRFECSAHSDGVVGGLNRCSHAEMSASDCASP